MVSASEGDDRRIGITTTVPLEILFAAHLEPLDLNNLFISSSQTEELVEMAERAGFPRNTCTWIKGIYSIVRRSQVNRIVGVVQGDCSNTHALMEILRSEGVETIEFAYPYSRDPEDLRKELQRFLLTLGVTWEEAGNMQERLRCSRELLHQLDTLTWQERLVTGEENFHWLLSSSDMFGDPVRFQGEMSLFLEEARQRSSRLEGMPLGLVGIPPIVSDLFSFLEERGARVAFNEIPRQFSMPAYRSDLVQQYREYTYPYEVAHRVRDIQREVERRGIKGLIHYVQSFCFRHIQDRLLREGLKLPILTLECDRPGPLSEQSRNRLEAFLEMVGAMNG